MKTKSTLLTLLSFCLFNVVCVDAQNVWLQEADFGGFARHHAGGFSIGNKGYIGMGELADTVNLTILKDFWQWDQSTNTWTQVADFAGGPRYSPSGFTINGYGYLAFGFDDIAYNDLWMYDATANTWTQKTSCPGLGRYGAFSFVLGDSVFIGSGSDNHPPYYFDVWMYNASTDSWKQKNDFPEGSTLHSIGCTVDSIAFVGGGYSESESDSTYKKSFWKYQANTDTWTKMHDIPGHARSGPAAFSINHKLYIGFGVDSLNAMLNDFYEFDPSNNTWSATAVFPGSPFEAPVSFSINNVGYVGTGIINQLTIAATKAFWQFGNQYAGINNISSDSYGTIGLYPNPANDFIHLNTGGSTADFPFTITNVIGQQVYSGLTTQKGINISSLPNGNYFLTTQLGKNTGAGMFTVQH